MAFLRSHCGLRAHSTGQRQTPSLSMQMITQAGQDALRLVRPPAPHRGGCRRTRQCHSATVATLWLLGTACLFAFRALAACAAAPTALAREAAVQSTFFAPGPRRLAAGFATRVPAAGHARASLAARGGGDAEEEDEDDDVGDEKPALPPPLTQVRAGDRFTGWLKHPVLTRGDKFSLVIEIGPGDDEGTWSIQRPSAKESAAPAFEGDCKVVMGTEGAILLTDKDTELRGTMNSPGPGSIAGRVAQCGLTWGGFFDAKLDIPEDVGSGMWPFR